MIRYLCFTATPRPGAAFPEKGSALPAVWENLQHGWDVPLAADPQPFLARLRRVDPRYTYAANLAGQATSPGVFYHLLGGPRPGDPRQCRVDFEVNGGA